MPVPKFIVDVNVGKAVETFLKKEGFDFISVRKINPRMADLEILELSVKENRVVITLDKDFGELVFNARKPHRGVLILRLEEANGAEKVNAAYFEMPQKLFSRL